MNMKAKNWIKAGFCLYIGWELSKALDYILGAPYMEWLNKWKPEFAARVEAEYNKAFTK